MQVEANFNYDKNAIPKVMDAIIKGLYEATIVIRDDAIEYCPFDTGKLMGSIRRTVNENKKYGIVFTNVEYAPHVEFGTKKMNSQPFMRPALYDNQTKIKDIIANNIKAVL